MCLGQEVSRQLFAWRSRSLTLMVDETQPSFRRASKPKSRSASYQTRIQMRLQRHSYSTSRMRFQSSIRPIYSKYIPYPWPLFLSHTISIQIRVDRTADWWLGQLDDEYFHALEDAVRDEWQAEPLRIREGGVSWPGGFACCGGY
jgi:hypothetical protein